MSTCELCISWFQAQVGTPAKATARRRWHGTEMEPRNVDLTSLTTQILYGSSAKSSEAVAAVAAASKDMCSRALKSLESLEFAKITPGKTMPSTRSQQEHGGFRRKQQDRVLLVWDLWMPSKNL